MTFFTRAASILKVKYLVVLVSGALFATLVRKILAMNFRYGLAITGGLVFLSISMMAIGFIVDFLVYAFTFNIPFATFGKWLMRTETVSPARGINLGLPELLLVLAYTVWFAQVFITRTKPLPRLGLLDGFMALLLFTQVISTLNAPDRMLAVFDIIYNFKLILLYFFLAHNVEQHHLKWLATLLIFALLFESFFGFFERLTGITNIGGTKGNFSMESFGKQYKVPGIEDQLRAMGTTYDSHALGLYLCMLIPVPFVLMTVESLKPVLRFVLLGACVIGIMGLVITFSRSGWLGFGVAAFVVMGIMLFRLKQRRAVAVILLMALAVSVCYPRTYTFLYRRLFQAPSKIMEVRVDMIKTALDLWSRNFLFGCGPANYIEAYSRPDVRKQHVPAKTELPVHNAFLWVAAELGLFGVVSFFGIIFLAMRRCWRAMVCDDTLIRCLSLAIFAAFWGYLADGINNPMFRETIPYTQLWAYIGMSVALHRLWAERTNE